VGLGLSPGHRWVWAFAQALGLIIMGLLNLGSALVPLSVPRWLA